MGFESDRQSLVKADGSGSRQGGINTETVPGHVVGLEAKLEKDLVAGVRKGVGKEFPAELVLIKRCSGMQRFSEIESGGL